MKNTYIYSVSSLLQIDTPYSCHIDLNISSLTAVTYCRLELQPVVTKIPKCGCWHFNIYEQGKFHAHFFNLWAWTYCEYTIKIFVLGQIGLSRQCTPRSDCSSGAVSSGIYLGTARSAGQDLSHWPTRVPNCHRIGTDWFY